MILVKSTPSPSAEKEIKELKAKQEGAQQAYAAAVTARESARGRLVAAESALAGVQAEEAHCCADLEASQARTKRRTNP